MKRSWLLLALATCLAFGLRALLLVDATALWSDELYSVGKSFQPSFGRLLAMLREDTHPPAYYALLWLWGHLVGQSPISLRLLSWLPCARMMRVSPIACLLFSLRLSVCSLSSLLLVMRAPLARLSSKPSAMLCTLSLTSFLPTAKGSRRICGQSSIR
jgi:hypothetical protein